MTERPILFNAPMVRAILAGTKTQTRRVVKPQGPMQPECWDNCIVQYGAGHSGVGWYAWDDGYEDDGSHLMRCPYGMPGDRLWVRETWRHTASDLDEARRITEDIMSGTAVDYRATYIERCMRELGFSREDAQVADSFEVWRPSIHMPRWASRILLEVVSVRVERLQDISIEDAKAEGAWPDVSVVADCEAYFGIDVLAVNPCRAFQMLWERINGAESWAANPWVWVVEFKRVEAAR